MTATQAEGTGGQELLLQVQAVDKSFPGVHAVDHVSLDVWRGEIHALVGENGAGKSTLMQILAGVYRPDEGSLLLDGKSVTFLNRHDAEMQGIGIVYQELSLVPNLSIAENMYAGRHPVNALGLVRWAKLYKDAQTYLDLFELGMDARTPVQQLSLASRQIVEIAKAMSLQTRLLILDEPTSSLSRHEATTLFGILRRLRAQGMAVIYISHHLEEVFALADRITVLRDGKHVASMLAHATDEQQVVSLMVGRSLEALEKRIATERSDEDEANAIALEVRGASREGEFTAISFNVRKGEIVGLGGLIGAGRSELAQALYGFTRLDAGEILINGRNVRIQQPEDAIKYGLVYLSEDRKDLGLFLGMNIAANIAAPNLKRLGRFGLISDRAANSLAGTYIQQLKIRTPGSQTIVGTLSGGNQQKVLLSTWLATKPGILLIDEPTRGIDVGTKQEIHMLLNALAQEGVAILMISSDLPELLALSDRVLVMSRGRLVGEFSREEASEERVMTSAAGLEAPRVKSA